MDFSELKLLEILKKRYNCNIEIHILNLIDGEPSADWKDLEKSIYRNRFAKFLINNGSIVFPIHRAEDTIVAIEVCNSEKLKPADLMQIKDCVELVFNDMYVLKDKRNLKKQQQTYLESQLLAPNVIPFRPREIRH